MIYHHKIKNNVFFEERDTRFVAWVAPRLHPIRVDEFEFVYQEGEVCTEMYFITEGEAGIVLIKPS